MALTAEQLNIILSVNNKDLMKPIMASQKRIERFAKNSQKSLSKTTRAFDRLSRSAQRVAPALAAVGAAFKIKAMINTTAQLGDLAAVAGENVERFQELSFAAKTFGVDTDKLSDILKDVNDKFGDFVETDGGPLKDFFENIAPKVGLTADAFANLSSSEKLGAYISALEKANVSQSEMTFYLEAIASDATLLQRLFANNGEELGRLTTKLRDAGGVIDAEIVAKAAKARETLELLSTSINNNAVIAIANLVEALQDASNNFAKAEASATSFLNSLGNFGRETPIKPEDFDLLLPGLFAGKSAKAEIQRLERELTDFSSQLAQLQDDFMNGDFPESRNFDEDQSFLQAKVRSTRTMLEDLQSQLLAAQKDYAEKTNQVFDNVAAKAANAIEVINASEIEDGGFVGLTLTAKELVDEMREMAELSSKSEAEQKRVLLSREKEKRLQEALNKLKKEGVDLTSAEGQAAASSIRQSLDLWERYELAAMNTASGVGKVRIATDELSAANERLKDVISGVEVAMDRALMSMVDGTSLAGDAFKAMTREIIRDLYRQFVVKRITGFVSDSISLFAGSAPGSTASLNLSGRASGGSVQAGMPYMVGEHGREPFVPAVNGRILSVAQAKDAISGGGGGSVVINQNIQVETGVSQTVHAEMLALMPQIKEVSKAAVLDAQMRGGF